MNKVSTKELVNIETNEYIIKGYITAPIGAKLNRIISEILNSDREFIALEHCKIERKGLSNNGKIEEVKFMEINKSSILMIKPISEY